MDSISTSLQTVMCESEPDEVGNRITQDAALEKLEEDVEGYLEKLKKLLEDNEEIIAEAIERNSQVITSITSVSVEQPTHSQDKFHCYSDLKPKYLEKDSTLLEVRSWILQTKNYIEAGYKTSPPKKRIVQVHDALATPGMDISTAK